MGWSNPTITGFSTPLGGTDAFSTPLREGGVSTPLFDSGAFSTPSFWVTGGGGGAEEYAIDSTAKLAHTDSLAYGSVDGPPNPVRTGIIKTTLAPTGTWNDGGGGCTVAQITDGADAYVELTPVTLTMATGYPYFMFGLGYAADAAAGTSANPNYAWIDWAMYSVGGTNTRVYENGVLKWGGGGYSWALNRTWRVQVTGNTVTYAYSDDGFATPGTVLYTSGTAVDIPGNSNLVGAFAIETPPKFVESWAANAGVCLQDVNLYGVLTGT